MIALLLVAVSLGLSNFAAAIGIGTSGVDNRTRLRVGLIFGVLEAGMPVAGLVLGRALAGPLGANAHYLGGALLIATGLYNLAQTYRSRRADDPVEPTEASPDTQPAPQHAGRLLITGVALSIDNLAVGFALGTYPVSLLLAAIIIGVVSVGLSLLGLELGRVLGNTLGQRGELLGGVVLIIVGIAITAQLL
jgi:manganese efflux pump family protein